MSSSLLPGLATPDPRLEREIRGRLREVETALEKAVRADSGMLGETAAYLLAAGGKRFRPMLVLLSGYFGDPADPRLIPGSVAMELIHVATLYHDDVIDEAASRRGTVSVNANWTNTIAILAGDFLLARASEVAAPLGTEAVALLARTYALLCEGQVLELQLAGNLDQRPADYFGVIEKKTASLIRASARLGA
ncbi:MAG TPA: polyprenyl synthetase family protein, partial [Actinomycetota bacterium]